MKRMISIIALSAMLLVLLSGTVSAADGKTLIISAESVTVDAGGLADITLTVEENPGFTGMVFYPIVKDSNNNKVEWNWTADMENTQLLGKRQNPFFDLSFAKSIVLLADSDCVATGILMDVFFYVPADATPGVYTVAFLVSEGECLNEMFEDVPVVMPTVTITVAPNGSAECTHRNTTEVAEEGPSCTEIGHTEGVFCNDCEKFISGHQPIPATEHHYELTDSSKSCTEVGSQTLTCTACGDTYTEPLQALGHSFVNYKSNNDATCTVDGTETAKCERCDVTDTRTVEGSALGHVEALRPGCAATCTETGLTDGKYCSVCYEVLVAQEPIPAGNHAFGEWETVTAATCTQQGQQTCSCTSCGETETEEIAKLEHSVAILEAVAATCTEAGLSEGQCCSVCNEVLVAQEPVPAGNHAFGEWETVTAATCTQQGQQTRACTSCGETESEDIAMLDHGATTLEPVAATCTETGLTEGVCCPDCQLVLTAQQVVPATGHSFGNWTVKTQPTTEAEGQEARTCADCGVEETRSVAKLPPEPKDNTVVIVAAVAVVLAGAGVTTVVVLKKKNT